MDQINRYDRMVSYKHQQKRKLYRYYREEYDKLKDYNFKKKNLNAFIK